MVTVVLVLLIAQLVDDLCIVILISGVGVA